MRITEVLKFTVWRTVVTTTSSPMCIDFLHCNHLPSMQCIVDVVDNSRVQLLNASIVIIHANNKSTNTYKRRENVQT